MSAGPGPTGSQHSSNGTRIGVALGGGSARGFAHIGVLQVLAEAGVRPTLLAGTSFGALIGALYGAGWTLAELERDAVGTSGRGLAGTILDFGLHKASLFDGTRLESFFDRLLDGRQFSDLETPLVVAATDADTGEAVLLDSGSIARAIRASTALPGIFSPVEIDGRRLMDGGIGPAVPLHALRAADLDIRIGIGAGLVAEEAGINSFIDRVACSRLGESICSRLALGRSEHSLARLGKALAISLAARKDRNPAAADGPGDVLHLQTSPPVSWVSFGAAHSAIQAGREATEGFLPQLRKAISDHLRRTAPALV